ncbi:MAG TPA: gluconokinase, partial [Gemmatimonadales bacterium]|nr:gluconokinase [Gemmatimonadales bacterium]
MAREDEKRGGDAVIGVDVGTSSARAFAFDVRGALLGGVKVPYPWTSTPDGGVETDAERIVSATAEALDGVLARMAPAARRVIAVGTAALWHSVVGLDAGGRPITPVYPWSDTRSAGAAARLRCELDGAEVHARTGAALHPSYLPARLRWLHDTAPAVCAQVRWWVSAAEYLEWRLLGVRRVSYSMASGTGLLDQRSLEWDDELLAAARISAEQLFPLADLDDTARGLQPEFADRWPALRNVPWLPAAGDGACANVGSGCTTPERIALSLGTSGALRLLDAAADVAIPPALWCYRLDRTSALWGGAVSGGGNVYAWLRRTLQLPSAEELERRLAESAADDHGLTVLPFLAGERSPYFPLDARMSIAGVTTATTAVEIAQAALEAVALRLALIRDALRRFRPDAGMIIASGAALRHSPAW